MFEIIGGELYQWDIGRKVQLLPGDNKIDEFHFETYGSDDALVIAPEEIDGVLVGEVPNIILQDNTRIFVHAVEVSEDKKQTVITTPFSIHSRKKPADYVYTETEVKRYDKLEERIATLEKKEIDITVDSVLDIESENPIQNKAVAKAVDDLKGETSSLKSDLTKKEILNTANGESIVLTDSAESKLEGLRVHGKSTQDGTPTPENPIPIVSVGDDGNVEVGVYGVNLFDANALLKYKGEYEVFENGRKITITGNAAYAYAYVSIDPKFLLGKTIYLKGTVTGGNSPAFTMVQYLKDGTKSYINSNDIKTGYVLGENVARLELQLICNNKSVILDAPVTAIFEDVMLTLDPSAEWEPYKTPQTLPIPTPNGLRGIKVTDASLATYTDTDGNMWVADEIDFERGVYVQNVREYAVTGDEDWRKSSLSVDGYSGFYINNIDFNIIGNSPKLCTHFAHANAYDWDNLVASEFIQNPLSSGINQLKFRILTSRLTSDTVDAFKEFLKANVVRFTYILSTPIETPISEEELTAYRALHTNYPVTTVMNDSGANMEVKYNADTKLYIDNKFAELQTALVALGGI